MRLTLLALIVAEISLVHCNSDCTLLLQKSTQLSQPFALDEQVKAEHGHVGPTRIPCVIHQTWNTHELSYHFAELATTWKLKNPKCEYKLWNETERAELCRQKSPDLIWPIWEALSPVQRADVFKYLVLWDQGGYYADIDVRCVKPIAEFPVPKDASMIAGYEAAHRLGEKERKGVLARVEQFETWFFASAPGNPVLLRALEIVREKFLWKVEDTVEFTGPGSFSDAVHEFLASDAEGQEMTPGVKKEVSYRTDHNDQHFRNLTFPSDSEYRAGNWNLWLLAAGRVAVPGYGADDPSNPVEAIIRHEFAGTWK